ncbi:MAG: LD-carboxypeptidase, partial [Oscillospiraceae bacterium]|nr:LD-carboxypeptidase [Oscillospiraceae bacterium]
MTAEKLAAGGAIGLICPSHVAEEATYRQITKTLERLGFRVKLGANIYKNTHGYLASPEERAGDLNAMVADDAVQMIFFGGGEGGNETLPYIDYAAIRQHPKIFSSYSDGTSILNAVYAKTGLVTYYGQSPGEFC